MRTLLNHPAWLAMLAAAFMLCMSQASFAQGDDKKIVEGKPAPDVELPATQIGKIFPNNANAATLKLKDLQGKKNVVLFFFPKAMTAG